MAINIEPYQFKPMAMASESDGESSDDSSDNNYDVNEERIGKVCLVRVRLFYSVHQNLLFQ